MSSDQDRPRVVEPEPIASAAPPFVPAIAESAAVPIVPGPGIGWPELAAVGAVLSIATVLLRRWFVVQAVPTGDAPIVVDVAEAETKVLSRV